MRKILFYFLGSLVFLALTVPANQLEAEDAYYYARMVEQGSGSELFHPHHLLYLPAGRTVLACARALGYTGRAFPILIALSILAGAASVAFFAGLLARAAPGRRVFALLLLFSYGFWRYGVTAEIYLPAMALMLGALYLAIRAQRADGWFWGGVGLSVAAGLMHLISLPLALAATPALYVLRRQLRCAILHVTVVAGIIAMVYGAVAAGPGWKGYMDPAVARDGWTQPLTWLKAAAAAGHTLLSGNFLFSWPSAADALQRWFPSRMLQEEIFMGQQAPTYVRWVASVTFVAAFIMLAAIWIRIFLRQRPVPRNLNAMRGCALIWLAGSAAMAMMTEPANPEMWVAALAPFWLLAAVLWPDVPPCSRTAKMAPMALAILLLAHNGIGGWAIIRSPRGDYARAKFEWLERRVGKGDLILTAESHSAVTWLQYVSPARVADAKFMLPEDWPKVRASVYGRVYVLGDVISPPTAVLRRDAASVARLNALADEIRLALTLVHEDVWGGVYEAVSQHDDGSVSAEPGTKK